MQNLYKFQNQYIFANRINIFSANNFGNGQEDENEEIEKILQKLINSYNSKDNQKIIYYLNKICRISEKYDICNHPLFISNSIYQLILSLFSANIPYQITLSAALAMKSFSYLFSKDLKTNSFDIQNLFLILKPEIRNLIFNYICEITDENVSALTEMLRKYCESSQVFRDALISQVTIESICEIIKQGIGKNATVEWLMSLIRLLCGICLYPTNDSQIISILTIFDGFDFSKLPFDITFVVLRTTRFIIENNDINNPKYQNILPSDNNNDSVKPNQNSINLVLKSKIPGLLNHLLDFINLKKSYHETNKYFKDIEDDICGITLLIYFLTNKQILVLPIQKMINFLQSSENSIVYNSLTFFSTYMNECKEKYDECDQNSFFNFLKGAIQFQSAKIRIHAGHVLFNLIQNADRNILKNLLLEYFFVLAFNLIQLNDVRTSIEMLIVMQRFIQFAIDSKDQKIADQLMFDYKSESMDETLNNLFFENNSDENGENDLSNFARITLEMMRGFELQFNFIQEEEEEEFEDNEYTHYVIMNDGNDEDQNDGNENNLFNEDNLEFADQLFKNTKPNPWI